MAVAEQQVQEFFPDQAELSKRFVGSVYDRFDATLRGYLVNKLRNTADAEDFAQEVYLRMARMDDHRKIQSVRAFLFTTATNLLRDRSRRLATQLEKASVCLDDVVIACTNGDPARRVQDAEQLELVQNALDDLTENCQRAFRLSRVDGLVYAEIAFEMGISVSMVEKHISAALRSIRNIVQD